MSRRCVLIQRSCCRLGGGGGAGKEEDAAEQHLLAANLAGGPGGRAEGGSGRGQSETHWRVGRPPSWLKWRSPFYRELEENKINSYRLYSAMRNIYPTNPRKPQLFLFMSAISHPSKDQVKHLPRCRGNWCLCCGSPLSLSLS